MCDRVVILNKGELYKSTTYMKKWNRWGSRLVAFEVGKFESNEIN